MQLAFEKSHTSIIQAIVVNNKDGKSPPKETAGKGENNVDAGMLKERKPAGGDGPVNASAGRMISRYTRKPVSHNLQM